MAKLDLSTEDKALVRNDIRAKVQELSIALDIPGIREARDRFLEKFIICETVYKIVLKKYLETNNKYDPRKSLKIQIEQVRTALQKAGYTPDFGLLDRLFNGSGVYKKRGNKSAKILRNGIEHEMNVKDMQEVVDRYNELMNDMDTFLEWIQN